MRDEFYPRPTASHGAPLQSWASDARSATVWEAQISPEIAILAEGDEFRVSYNLLERRRDAGDRFGRRASRDRDAALDDRREGQPRILQRRHLGKCVRPAPGRDA